VPDYDASYYREVGGERQTTFDRARDDRVVGLVRQHAPPRHPGSAILDIGCGYGHLLARFTGGYRLCGVDLSPHAAERTLVRLPKALVVQADVGRGLPFGPRFDVVLAVNVIEHLDDPRAAVDAIASVLVPGGLCVAHLPTINNTVSRLLYRFAYSQDPTHIYRPSGPQVRALFEAEGFERVEESYAPHTRWLLSELGWHPAYLAAFVRR
jgi:SAM-dependent methyltransferase